MTSLIIKPSFRDVIHLQKEECQQEIQGVQLKTGPYFNTGNLFAKIYNMLYYTTKLYLQ